MGETAEAVQCRSCDCAEVVVGGFARSLGLGFFLLVFLCLALDLWRLASAGVSSFHHSVGQSTTRVGCIIWQYLIDKMFSATRCMGNNMQDIAGRGASSASCTTAIEFAQNEPWNCNFPCQSASMSGLCCAAGWLSQTGLVRSLITNELNLFHGGLQSCTPDDQATIWNHLASWIISYSYP